MRAIGITLGLVGAVSILLAAQNAAPGPGTPATQTSPAGTNASDVTVTVNQSVVLEHAAGIRRLSISSPEIAEAVAVSTTEVLINGKSEGETTLILWDSQGGRQSYDVHVVPNEARVDAVRSELLKEFGPGVSLTVEDGNAFLRGTVADEFAADRAAAVAATVGKIVNLLDVVVPPQQMQILLKVRFANVSRSAALDLGFNFFSGNSKGVGNATTGQYGAPPSGLVGGQTSGQGLSLSNLLNLTYFRPDLNIGAVIEALEAKSLAQTLAEPNLLTVSGRPASFLAGGEFPFPTIQGGASGVGQITIQFKEYGIRLNFLPTITPRGTIKLQVMPEVSSLDYVNALTVSGYTVPGLATRRVQTEVELEDGQSFVIAGLLDKELTKQFDRIPGIGNIPVLGKLFQSKSIQRNDSELLVLVTPELVRPVPVGGKAPEIKMPLPFLPDAPTKSPQTPGPDVTGAVIPPAKVETVPIQEIKAAESAAAGGSGNGNAAPANGAPFMPVMPSGPQGAGANGSTAPAANTTNH